MFGEVRPPPREQGEWRALCPNGGELLKLQVCIAAQGEEGSDWFIGRLFVAEVGLFVESTDDKPYQSALRKWEDITELSDDHPTKTKKNEVLVSMDGFKLRIDLGSPSVVEWLQLTHGTYTSPVDRFFSIGTAFGDDDFGDDVSKATIQPLWYAGHPAFDFTDEKVPDVLPMVSIAKKKEKLFYDSIQPQTKIQEISKVMLREEWPFVELLADNLNCHDIGLTPWKESARFPEGQIRCCQYTMPVPKNKNIPDGIQRMLGVPDFALCTSHYRIQVDKDQVTVLMQSGTRGVKHGDNMCIQALMTWRQEGEDVVFQEWFSLIWVVKLGLLVSPAKPFIEGQAKEDALVMAKHLDNIIKKEITKARANPGVGAAGGAAASSSE